METLTTWLIENTSLIIPYILGSGGILAYFFERRKRNIDLKQQDATALQTMQAAYDRFTEDSLKKFKDLQEEQDKLKEKFKKLEEDFDRANQILRDTTREYKDLKEDYDTLFDKYQECTKDVDI